MPSLHAMPTNDSLHPSLCDTAVGPCNTAHLPTGPFSLAFRQPSGNETADRTTADAALVEQVHLFESALANMSQGLCMFDAQSRLVVSNRRYHELFGIPTDAIDRGMTQHGICAMLIAKGVYPPTETLERIEEQTRLALQSGDGLPALAGGGWLSTFEDVTDRRRSEARIAHLAHHDSLTDLANTRALRASYRDLVQVVDAARPMLALCYVDLDRFKFINDTYGHAVGDELLQAVAERLRMTTRRADIAARLGGDEFALVMRVADGADAMAVAQRLLGVLSQPYDVSSGRLDVGASIGVTTRAVLDMAPDWDIDPLLHDADLALRHAKTAGRGAVTAFEPRMSEAAQARSLMEADLRTALAEEQFELHYQTLVDIRESRVVGVEALVRWHHPARGLQSPLSFIAVMEETGLIVPLGRWVLERACRDALRWPAHVVVAVNVSSVQVRQPSFGASVVALLAETGLPAQRLEIEITESSLLEESEITRANLATIHEAGIRIAMDDFGTGYSSLSYLRRFPIDKIKIDRSFMQDAETSADARAIIRAVAGLGTSLGITTLVEGVETERQLDLARAEGVGQVQGYLFSRPQPEPIISSELSR
jgi:diguanylate cyclase (GGDEF)-like protein